MRLRHMSPTRYARTGGALYLIIIFTGIVGPLLTRERLLVSGNLSATAENIAASPGLWRVGIALDVVMQVCDVPVMLILFLLLSPVNSNIARLALLFNIVQTATLVANQQNLVAAQLASPDQPALTDIAVDAYSYGDALGLIFFGFTLIGTGYLIRHSSYLPWLVGWLVQVAGVGYILNGFLLLLAPMPQTSSASRSLFRLSLANYRSHRGWSSRAWTRPSWKRFDRQKCPQCEQPVEDHSR